MQDEKLFEHYWKYFEIHSQQRMTVFNFYLAIVGLISAGIGFGLQQGEKFDYLVSSMSLFLMFVSFLFYKMDERVSTLIKRAENGLTLLEGQQKDKSKSLFHSDKLDSDLNASLFSPWSYGRCFRISFITVGNISFIISFAPFIN